MMHVIKRNALDDFPYDQIAGNVKSDLKTNEKKKIIFCFVFSILCML